VALLTVLRSFLQVGKYKTALQFLSLLGLMTATLEMVLHARFHMRPLQFYVKHRWRAALGFQTRLLITHQLPPLLAWWLDESNLDQGVPLIFPSPQWILTTDASGVGWGGHVSPAHDPTRVDMVQGQWSYQESQLHINLLELRAVRLTLHQFRDILSHSSVHVETDNTTVVSHINKQGGVKSWSLWNETKALLDWAWPLGLTLRAVHRPGVDNELADSLSRRSLDPHEWMLKKRVVERIFQIWGRPQIDLFASPSNAHLPQFCQRAIQDAFQFNWNQWRLYAFPPIPMLPRTLRKVRDESAQMILVAPWWPAAPWFSLLTSQMIDFPIALPKMQDLLTQEISGQGRAHHSDLESLHLTAWRLSGVNCEQKDFQRKLSTFHSGQLELPPGRFMMHDGQHSQSGALPGTWFPVRRLFHRF
jgi:ribonuclease HI